MADGGSDLISAIRPGVEIGSRAPGSGAGRQAERVTQPAGGVPTIRWGPDTIGRRGLFEAWHEAARPLFDTAPGGQERSFSGGGTVARLGELIVTEVDFTGQRFCRTRRHIAETGGFSLQLSTRGGVVGTTEDMPYRLAPDRIALFDFSRERQAIATQPSQVLGASIPRDRLDTTAAVDPPAVIWSRRSPAGRLLIGALRLLRGEIDRLPAAQAAEAAAGVIGLLNGLLGSRREIRDPRLVRQLCLATMERYIERNPHRPELDAALLGRAFASSRTRLYDLFREHGGVERYLRQRRLSRCFRDLAAADPGCGRVKGVAQRWGFGRPKMKRLSFATLVAVALSATSLTPAAFAQEEMRCSHQLPPAHHVAGVIDRWAEEVETLSEGEIDVQIFGADSLVGADDNIIAVAKGDIECAFSVNFQWGRTLPIMNVTLAPYAFGDLDMWRRWPTSEAADFLAEKLLEKGVRNIGWLFTTNTSVFTSNGKPLVAPADFEGMKIRGLVPAFNASLEALGASPVSMPGSEVYQALATGVIDGGLTDVAAAVSRKYYEVQDYFTVVPVISVYFHGYVNPDWYDGLSDKAKAALEEAGDKAAVWAIEAAEQAAAAAPDQLREKGVTVHVATNEENAALEAVMRPAFDAAFAAEDEDSQKLIELLGQL